MGAVERTTGLTGGVVGDWFSTNLMPNKQT
jgi:hypothetical protein